jgi:hypothetical protein
MATRYKIAPVLFRIFLLIGGVLLLNFRQAAAVSDVAGIQLCNRLLFTEDSGFGLDLFGIARLKLQQQSVLRFSRSLISFILFKKQVNVA